MTIAWRSFIVRTCFPVAQENIQAITSSGNNGLSLTRDCLFQNTLVSHLSKDVSSLSFGKLYTIETNKVGLERIR